MEANPFDQFDAPATAGGAQPAETFQTAAGPRQVLSVAKNVSAGKGANPFDQFDAHAAEPVGNAAPEETPDGKQLAAELRAKADKMLLEHAGGGASSPLYAGLSAAANTAMLNIPRNVGAGLRSATGGGTFDQEYNYLKDIDEAAARQSPKANIAGVLGGAVAGGAAIPVAPAASIAGRIGQGALIGAGLGGGAELADTKDIGHAAKAAALGGAVGGVAAPLVEGATGLARGLAQKAAPQALVPTTEGLKDAAQRAYQQSENAGAMIRPEGIQKLHGDLQTLLAEKGYHPALTHQNKIHVALNELEKLGGGYTTLKGLDIIRQIANGARADSDASTRRVGGAFVGKLDEFIDKLSPQQLIGGNSLQAVQGLREGQKNWRLYRKAEMIDKALTDASLRAATTGSGGNAENAIRQEFRRLLTNEKKARAFTPDEKAAILRVAQGGTARDLARWAGKISPHGNGLSLIMHLGAAAASHGASLPVAAAGAVAKHMADTATKRAGERVSELVRSGGQKAPTGGLSSNDIQRLSNTLTSLGVQASHKFIPQKGAM